MKADFKIIGAKIRKMRKAQLLSQENLSESISVSIGYISQIERGTTKVSLETLYRIAGVLKCSIHDLLPTDIPAEKNNSYLVEEENAVSPAGHIRSYIESIVSKKNISSTDYNNIMLQLFPYMTRQQQQLLCYIIAASMAINDDNKIEK